MMVCPNCHSSHVLECIIPGYEVVCDTCWWRGQEDELVPAPKPKPSNENGDH